jgi:hypothetical protein
VTEETIIPSLGEQTSHYLGINEIEISTRRYVSVKSWAGDRRLRSLNIAANDRTRKDYDSIVDISLPDSPNSIIRLGFEYERTLKSKERYAEIRKVLDQERQIHALVYFVDSDENALRIARTVYSDQVPVSVIVLEHYQSAGISANVRTVVGKTVEFMQLSEFLNSIALSSK